MTLPNQFSSFCSSGRFEVRASLSSPHDAPTPRTALIGWRRLGQGAVAAFMALSLGAAHAAVTLGGTVTVNADGYGSSTNPATSTFPAGDPDGSVGVGRNNGQVCTNDLMNYKFNYNMTPGPGGETTAPGGQLDIQVTQGVLAMPPIAPSNQILTCGNVLPANHLGSGNAQGEWSAYDPALASYTYYIAGSQQSHLICAPLGGIVATTSNFDLTNVRVLQPDHGTTATATLVVRSTDGAAPSAPSTASTTVISKNSRNIVKWVNGNGYAIQAGPDLVSPGFRLNWLLLEPASLRCTAKQDAFTVTDNAGSISPNALLNTWTATPAVFAPSGFGHAYPYGSPTTSYYPHVTTLQSVSQPGGAGTPIVANFSRTPMTGAALASRLGNPNFFNFPANQPSQFDFEMGLSTWIPDSDVPQNGCRTFTNEILTGAQADNGPDSIGRADSITTGSSVPLQICRSIMNTNKFINRMTAAGAGIVTDRVDWGFGSSSVASVGVLPNDDLIATPYIGNASLQNRPLTNAQVCDLLPPEMPLITGSWGTPARAWYSVNASPYPKVYDPALQVEYGFRNFGAAAAQPPQATAGTVGANATRTSITTCDDASSTFGWFSSPATSNFGGNTPNMVRIKSGATLPATAPGPYLGIDIAVKVQASAQPNDRYFNFMLTRADETHTGVWTLNGTSVLVLQKYFGVSKAAFLPDRTTTAVNVTAGGATGLVSFRLRAYGYYNTTYGTNGAAIQGIVLEDYLPPDVTLVGVSAPYTYDAGTRKITVALSDLIIGNDPYCGLILNRNPAGNCGIKDVWVDVQVNDTAPIGTLVKNTNYLGNGTGNCVQISQAAPYTGTAVNGAPTGCANVTVQRVNNFKAAKRLMVPEVNTTDTTTNAWFIDNTNLTAAALASSDVIDILPVQGDSAFDIRTGTGPATYTSVAAGASLAVTSVNVPAAPVGGAITIYYSTTAAGTLNDDPSDASNVLPSANWTQLCTRPDGAAAPACTPPAGTTALRIVITNLPAATVAQPNGTTYSIGLSTANTGNNPGDRWCNSVFGRAAGFALPVRSINTCLKVKEIPALGVAKRMVSSTGPDANGIYTHQFEVKIHNVGNVTLTGVTLEDNLQGALNGAAVRSPIACPAPISGLANNTYCISAMPTVTGTFGGPTINLNSAYTGGGTNAGILLPTSILPPDAQAVFTLTAQVKPGLLPNYINNNTALGGGSTPTGTLVTDSSVNTTTPLTVGAGTSNQVNPDGSLANGYPDPSNDSTPTPVIMPRIDLAKAVTLTTPALLQGDGVSYTQSFDILVKNSGNEDLTNVQVLEQLDATGGAGTTISPYVGFGTYTAAGCAALAAGQYSLVSAPIFAYIAGGSSPAINPSYTGVGTGATAQLLAAGSTLQPLDSATIRVSVCFRPTIAQGVINNTATATGTGAQSGRNVSDVSQNGSDPDQGSTTGTNNGDYWAGNNAAPTPTTFNNVPQIGLAKTLIGTTNVTSGTYAGMFKSTFRVRVQNVASAPLSNIVVNDDLTGATRFGTYTVGVPTVGQYTIASAPVIMNVVGTVTATANATYTGSGTGAPLNLITGASTLGLASRYDIEFAIYHKPATYSPAALNQAYATAQGPSGTPTADLSHNTTLAALNADPNGDGFANGTNTAGCSTDLANLTATAACENTPTPVPLPAIASAKTVGTPVYNHTGPNAGTVDIPYSVYMRNIGGENIDTVLMQENLLDTFAGVAAADLTVLTTPPAALAAALGPLPVAGANRCYYRRPSTAPWIDWIGGTNAAFNGTTVINVTNGVGTFLPNDDYRCDFTVRVRPGTLTGPFFNSALIGGRGTGTLLAVADYSNNFTAGATLLPATVYDPNGNGVANESNSTDCPATSAPANLTAACENLPTPVSLVQGVDLIKAAGAVTSPAFLTFRVPYTLVAKNTSGVVVATNVQVTDNLCSTFTAVGCPGATASSPTLTISTAPSIAAAAGNTCSLTAAALNSGYTGVGAVGSAANNLLTGQGSNLQQAEACAISFTVQLVYPTVASVPAAAQNNSATIASYATPPASAGGTGTGVLGSDTSTNGNTIPATGSINLDAASPTPVTLSVAVATVSGKVYDQINNTGIGGQTITLSGTDSFGNPVSRSVTTATAAVAAGTLCASQPALAIGDYYFCDLPASNASGYTISQPAQPAGTVNGTTTAGSVGGSASNPTSTTSQISTVVLSGGQNSTGNNFGEISGFTVSGTVWNDANNTANNAFPANINANSPSADPGTNAGALNAVLVDSTGKVIQVVAVGANGTYTFPQVQPANGYQIVLATSAPAIGSTIVPSATASLPNGWVGTSPLVMTAFNVVGADVTGKDFGIEQPPTAVLSVLASQVNPGGSTRVQGPTLSGTDPEDGAIGTGGTFTIATVPNPATMGNLYYNNVLVTPGTVITNYDPALLTVDPIAGSVNVQFTYTVTDKAGKVSAPVNASAPFTVITLSGTVYDDANGSAGATPNGAGTFPTINQVGELTTNAGGLNAVLTDSAGNVLAVVPVTAGGTYVFPDVPPNISAQVRITTANPAVGSAAAAAVLPTGWTNTSPLIYPAFNTGLVNTAGKDFGIEQLPTADNKSAASQPNPGGTVRVAVPALSGTDPEDGGKGAGATFTIETLPSNATLYYNGVAIVIGTNNVIANYDPALLTVDPNDGGLTVSFTYSVTDAASKKSAPATVTMPFDQLLITGNVFADLNMNKVQETPAEAIAVPAVNAVLLDSTGAVVAVTAVNTSNGSYSFPVAPNQSYTVLLSTASPALGTVNPAVALPANWLTTGENLNGVIEATPDSRQAVSVATTSVVGVNFGIVQSADTTSAITCVANPADPAQPTVCTVTCTNNGPGAAVNATCNFTGVLPAGITSNTCPVNSASQATGAAAALSCAITFPAPLNGTVNLTAGSGATNDSNGGSIPTAGNNASSASLAINGVTVSGRVYREASTPANSTDDGNATDPGLAADVSINCVSPAFTAGPTATNADGSYSFTGVPAGSTCTITETQPSGYTNAYNTIGSSAVAGNQTGGTAGSTGDSSITIVVPFNGSTGNNFAEQSADVVSSTVCTPTSAEPGSTITCTVTCTNNGPGMAANAFCSVTNAASLPGSPVPVCSANANLAISTSLTCTVSFLAPTQVGLVTVRGGSGADNDIVGGSAATAGNNPSAAPFIPHLPVPVLNGWSLLLLALAIALLAATATRYRAKQHRL